MKCAEPILNEYGYSACRKGLSQCCRHCEYVRECLQDRAKSGIVCSHLHDDEDLDIPCPFEHE